MHGADVLPKYIELNFHILEFVELGEVRSLGIIPSHNGQKWFERWVDDKMDMSKKFKG